MCFSNDGIHNVLTGRGELLEKLREITSACGHISREAVIDLAASFDIAVSEIYGVASFYSFMSTKPRGRNIIRVCKSVPCYLKNSRAVVEAVQKTIGISPGNSTPDGRYAFELTNCIGGCDEAPAMLVNDDFHGRLTEEKIGRILRAYD